jgi:hypothetical protein
MAEPGEFCGFFFFFFFFFFFAHFFKNQFFFFSPSTIEDATPRAEASVGASQDLRQGMISEPQTERGSLRSARALPAQPQTSRPAHARQLQPTQPFQPQHMQQQQQQQQQHHHPIHPQMFGRTSQMQFHGSSMYPFGRPGGGMWGR